MNRKVAISILTLAIVALGFLRGYLFGNINWIYKTLTVNRPNAARHEFYFLLDWEANSILKLKWLLTFIFFGLFWLMTLYIVKVVFDKSKYNKSVHILYLGMLGLSALLYLTGYLLGYSREFYHLVRTVMGIAQSFMPLMILVIIIKFLPQPSSK